MALDRITISSADERGTLIRCSHGNPVAVIEKDGTVVIRHRDGCELRIPPIRVVVEPVANVVVQQTVLARI